MLGSEGVTGAKALAEHKRAEASKNFILLRLR
jgi:hypothetical protein